MDTEMNNSLQPIDPDLLTRFLSGDANADEQREVGQWMEAAKENRKYVEDLSLIWDASPAAGEFDNTYLNMDWEKVKDRMKDAAPERSQKSDKQRSLYFQLTKVAALVIFSIGFYFLSQHIYTRYSTREIIASSGAEMMTLHLEDGSNVYLKSNSTLTYPEKFKGNTRAVALEGEAFFEVVGNKQRPFLIQTGAVHSEVLGTSFSINSKQNRVVVTVLTGTVLLYKDKGAAIALTAGEQGTYSDRGLEKKINDDPNFMSWKTNILTFQNTPVQQVVDDLNRHYGTKIHIAGGSLQGCTLTATFRDQPLENILNELHLVFSAHIEKTGDIIIIQGKRC